MPSQEDPPGDCQASHLLDLLLPTQHRMPSVSYVGLLALFMSGNREQCGVGLNLLLKTFEKEWKINWKKDPTQGNKGHIFMSWNTSTALWASFKTLVLFKKMTKIQHRKVLYPISCASKPDVHGQLEVRILHISLSYKFSLCFPLWHIINSNKIPLTEIPTGTAQVLLSLFGFKQEFYLWDHMRETEPHSFPNTAAVNSCYWSSSMPPAPGERSMSRTWCHFCINTLQIVF